MTKILFNILCFTLFFTGVKCSAQTLQTGIWRGVVQRSDGRSIMFNFEWIDKRGQKSMVLINANDRTVVNNITQRGDSIFVQMPTFDSYLALKIMNEDNLSGEWIKGAPHQEKRMPFIATSKTPYRILPVELKTAYQHQIAGRWKIDIQTKNKITPGLAEIRQNGSILTGTIMTPSGDYRYMEGIIIGDSMELSVFDGGFCIVASATIASNDAILSNGTICSGNATPIKWTAVRNDSFVMNRDAVAMRLKNPKNNVLNFCFPDLDDKKVCIHDSHFKNKVVIVAIMGSWCPNCLDEMAFLSEYYRENKRRGVEIVALAYEYSTNVAHAKAGLNKFKNRLKVTYPILLTGVSVSDSLRTEKTLPQLTPIKSFPSCIILGKKGRVRKIDVSFSGPATGIHYEIFKKEFEHTIDELLKEK